MGHALAARVFDGDIDAAARRSAKQAQWPRRQQPSRTTCRIVTAAQSPLTPNVINTNYRRVNPSTPSPHAATERFAERFGEISQGLAANGGGDRLSALLIHLIERLIQAILSIARNLPAATAPVEPETTAFPPQRQHNPPVRPGPSSGHSPRRQEPTRPEPTRQERPAPEAGEPPGSGRQTPGTLPPTARPGTVRHRAPTVSKAGGGKRPGTTAPPRRPPKNRVFGPDGSARPNRSISAMNIQADGPSL